MEKETPTTTEVERRLLGILEAGDHKKKEIIRMLNNSITGCHYGDRDFRDVVADLVVKYGVTIGSNSTRGYFLVKTEKDLSDALNDLKSREIAARTRARELFKSFYKDGKEPQLEFPFEEN